MKKVVITIFAKTYHDLAQCADFAAMRLKTGCPSENETYENRSHYDYTVQESSDEEFCEQTNEDPENGG